MTSDDGEQVIDRMERLVAAADDADTVPLDEGDDPIARDHRETIQRGAGNADE
ncbi:transcription regulator [Halorubrum coriense DSM 10284]|uniref:Transcription regulator n=1 Tax=Halorubrum coriense DSM 10284 TaxID=1227466 RepID=M0EL98_9EURY|nr:hypothetical protein [Halorubrum coriense]ELZ47878.1 transcription regulator [Halorubrum coriense DSM 10284]